MPGETFDLVTGLVELGFMGSGGGARSGSELSHLRFHESKVSHPSLYEMKLEDLRRPPLQGTRLARTWARTDVSAPVLGHENSHDCVKA